MKNERNKIPIAIALATAAILAGGAVASPWNGTSSDNDAAMVETTRFLLNTEETSLELPEVVIRSTNESGALEMVLPEVVIKPSHKETKSASIFVLPEVRVTSGIED